MSPRGREGPLFRAFKRPLVPERRRNSPGGIKKSCDGCVRILGRAVFWSRGWWLALSLPHATWPYDQFIQSDFSAYPDLFVAITLVLRLPGLGFSERLSTSGHMNCCWQGMRTPQRLWAGRRRENQGPVNPPGPPIRGGGPQCMISEVATVRARNPRRTSET